MPEPLHIHIPTPGDHYSPATGSAIMTITHEIACEHAQAGGQTRVIVSEGTRQSYDVGEAVTVPFRALPQGKQKLVDVALGRLGATRPFISRTYLPSVEAVPRDFNGPVIVHNAPAVLPLVRKQCPNAQVLLWMHNELFRAYGDREMRRVLDGADWIIGDSRYTANTVLNRLPELENKTRVILNGVNIKRFQPASGEDAEDGLPVVLFVGRVVPEKGADLLLRAAAKAFQSDRRFRVRIVGSSGFSASDPLTPYEKELRELARPLGKAVTFQPFVDREAIREEYRHAAIFCVPSNWDEPCSLTAPEGLACGLPMIVSRRGGLPEVGQDAVLYFTPPDVDEFATHLADFLDNADKRAEYARRARLRAESLSWACQYQQLRALLQERGRSAR